MVIVISISSTNEFKYSTANITEMAMASKAYNPGQNVWNT